MPRRPAQDGGHSVFTDHRIARRPPIGNQPAGDTDGELAAWRRPSPALEQRNFALALANAGMERRSPPQIVRGYRLLTEVQKSFPDDIDVLNGLGMTLLLGKEPREALRAFERVLELTPGNPIGEQNVGMAWNAAGQLDQAAAHLERCLDLDPLLLPAAATLMNVYRQQGDAAKESALANRIRKAMSSAPVP
jgi:tetratricopeptide (TPR) repeat protein